MLLWLVNIKINYNSLLSYKKSVEASSYEKGKEIHGIDLVKNSLVFHAGTKFEDNKVLSNGGRVLAVTSYGNDFKSALKQSYESINHICFDKINFRKDIGFDL